MKRAVFLVLCAQLACSGGSQGASTPHPAPTPPRDPLAGCVHDLERDASSLWCDDVAIESRALKAGEAAVVFERLTSTIAGNRGFEEDRLEVGGRSYPARRVRGTGAFAHGLVAHSQTATDPGRVFACAPRRARASAADPCRAALARLIAGGLPPASPPTATILGVALAVPAGCRLEPRDIRCPDDSRLTWRESLDRAQVDRADRFARAPEAPEEPCTALGVPATCRRGTIVTDWQTIDYAQAIVERDGAWAWTVCSWPYGAAMPPLCAGVFAR
jgi:hypothetical protein